MKRIVLILLFTSQLFAQYYVSNSAAGNGSGDSPANADLYTDNYWGSISAGDTIFFCGGADSLVYSSTYNVGGSGSWNNYIYIMPAKYSKYSATQGGKVIFDLGDANNYGISVDSRSWVYIKGFEIRETGNDAVRFYLTARHCVVDSLTIYNVEGASIVAVGAGCGGAQGYNMDDWDSTDVCMDIEVKNCYILSHEDNWPGAADLTHWACVRDIKIHDNIIWNRNVQSAAPPGQHVHMDDIQCYNAQGFQIYNNVLVIDSAVYGHNMIISCQSRDGTEYSGVDECIIYNNMVYHGGHLAPGGNPSTQHYYNRWYGSTSDMAPTYVFHNTFFWANGSGPNFELQRKLIAKNNIMYDYGTLGKNPSDYGGAQTGFWSAYWGGAGSEYQYYIPIDSCTGNLFWKEWTVDHEPTFGGNIYTGDGNTGSATWTTWQSTYNGTGINEDPLFVTDFRTGYHDIASNSPAIDAGEQTAWIRAFLEARGLPITDFYGNPRDANWDIGAMEYQSGVADTVPNSFTFTDVTNATRSTLYTSNLVTFTGFDSAYAYAGGYEYQINSGSWRTGYTKVFNNDNARVRLTSSGNYNTAVSRTLTVGGRSDTYTVTTGSAPSGNGKLLRSADGKVIKDANGNKIIVRF